jgi:hypothetical protein
MKAEKVAANMRITVLEMAKAGIVEQRTWSPKRRFLSQ